MIPDSFRKPVCKEDKLSGLGAAKGVLEAFHEGPLLSVFEQQVTQGACLRLAGSHQLGKKDTLFLHVMVFVRKDPEKSEKCFRVFAVNSFRVFPFDKAFKDIDGTENDFMI